MTPWLSRSACSLRGTRSLTTKRKKKREWYNPQMNRLNDRNWQAQSVCTPAGGATSALRAGGPVAPCALHPGRRPNGAGHGCGPDPLRKPQPAHDLGLQGFANVKFMEMPRLAELLGAASLAGRRPLTGVLQSILLRKVLERAEGPLAPVRDHTSTQNSLRTSFGDLRNLDDEPLRRLEAPGGISGEVARLYRQFRTEASEGLVRRRGPVGGRHRRGPPPFRACPGRPGPYRILPAVQGQPGTVRTWWRRWRNRATAPLSWVSPQTKTLTDPRETSLMRCNP